ncbi:MAG: hypothetical protein HY326_11180, partial [Chloroflexi bacterium]|nr:hypothetical protein [Chloroflexota bacterium]
MRVFSVISGLRGVVYLYEFFYSYLLLPFVFIALLFLREILIQVEMRLIMAILLLWGAYIVFVGGDFMEFRLVAPVLPFLFILVLRVLLLIKEKRFQVALAGLIFTGSLTHALTFNGIYGIESVPALYGHITTEHWDQIGSVLRELFPDPNSRIVIATTAAGAIPYYSQLMTIDMLGLNDKWVARYGLVVSSRPGHERIASLEYLIDRNVHLVIGHPLVDSRTEVYKTEYSIKDLERFRLYQVQPGVIPDQARIVEIPLDDKFKFTILYLTQNAYIDSVIAQRQLKT